MKRQIQKRNLQKCFDILSVLFILIAVHFIIGMFTGKWPWSYNPYNSYLLQALSWIEGRLDLGQNYEYLELAIYNNKYYVSFPPFPSYILLPFALIFKERTPEGWIAFVIMLLGAIYALRIAWELIEPGWKAVFWTTFLFIGTNILYITLDAAVWFIAQSFATTLSLMALYYALKGKGGLSFFFWGCSVGCRPLQVLYFPIVFYLLYKYLKKKNPNHSLLSMIKQKFYWAIPVCIIAFSYMILNYARFDNPVEFGHNYLPEFMREENGQFHISYLANNLKSLILLPTWTDYDTLSFPRFNGFCIFLVSPLYVSYLVYYLRKIVRRQKIDGMFLFGLPCLIILHIVALCLHRTMGGAHFGHRYINDTLPYLYFGVLLFAGTYIPTQKTISPISSKDIDICKQPDTFIAENSIPVEDDEEENEVAVEVAEETKKENFTDLWKSDTEQSPKTDDITEELPSVSDYTYTFHYAFFAFGVALNIVGSIVEIMRWGL